jgi:hypothetical protein
MTVSGVYQEREFLKRPYGENKDEYWQVGAGLRHAVKSSWAVSIQWGYSIYTWPDGSNEDSYRLAFGIQYSWGRRNVVPLPAVDIDAVIQKSGGSIQKSEPDGSVWFRIQAHGAAQVFVGGSFNGWDPGATPLVPVGDGWWEISINLEPGIYEYTYVIDGEWITPPEAKLTVEDGFGGRNGILEVLPPDL